MISNIIENIVAICAAQEIEVEFVRNAERSKPFAPFFDIKVNGQWSNTGFDSGVINTLPHSLEEIRSGIIQAISSKIPMILRVV